MYSLLRKNKGITLIELLVALVISGILVGGIYRTFIGQQKTYTVQERVVDMQQNVSYIDLHTNIVRGFQEPSCAQLG